MSPAHRRRSTRLAGRTLAVCLAATGCTAEVGSQQPTVAPSGETSSSAPASSSPAPPPSSTEGTSPTFEPRVHPVSIPALFERKYDGRGLRPGRVLFRTDAYTQRFVTYRSGDLRISGVLNVPNGKGPFPALVLAHGYIDPAIYVNGQGLRREQDFLARAGFVVLHADYRNHAASDVDPTAERRLRLGYTVDVINAVHALRRSRLPVDRERIGLLGRSMGGGVVYNALTAQPGLVDAAVVYAPVSSRTADNFNRWIRSDPGRAGLERRILNRYGAPERRPGFWRRVSPRTYFHRISEPVLIHHGTADESCPIRWSRQSHRALRRAGVDARMLTYPGEPHAFIAAWPQSMRRTVRFFNRHLS